MQNKQHHSAVARQQHISDWQQSGLSKKEYCRQQQLNYLTFISWFQAKRKSQTLSSPSFIPLEVTSFSNIREQVFATLQFGNNTVQLHATVNAAFLAKLLRSCR